MSSRSLFVLALLSPCLFAPHVAHAQNPDQTVPNPITAAPIPITPPEQSALGPGGWKEVAYATVRRTYCGTGAQAYWLFEPAEPYVQSDTVQYLPVIIFNHGWSATNPRSYGAWIDHLVRRGNFVIFPRYQADLATPPLEFTPNAIAAVKAAFARLAAYRGPRPDLTRVAVVGHSMGGILSANLAALAKENGLPPMRAVMSVEPGITWGWPLFSVTLADLKAVPADTLLLSVAGQDDTFVRDVDAKRIFNETTNVPAENKNYIVLPSDAHGTPALVSSHFAPVASEPNYDDGETRRPPEKGVTSNVTREANDPPRAPIGRAKDVNTLDFGLWRLFDALCDAAFYKGRNREYALGNTPQQRSLGVWSDGTPVKELVVNPPVNQVMTP